MKQEFNVTGLCEQEVQERIQKGLVNHEQKSMTKSTSQILKENIFTLFNLLNFLIALALAWVGAWSNLLFIGIILANIVIGIYQQLHAKKLIDQLSLLIVPMLSVLRDGKEQKISVNELVMDDLMILTSGQQIVCDGEVISGEAEVNEALLTGESDPVHKSQNDTLLSGSSIIAGKCYAKVIHIGTDNYATHIASEVKKAREVQSEFMTSMRKVTKITCALIIPLGILLFLEAFYLQDSSIHDSIVSSSAGLLGMLPKGLVLLISVSLATGVSKLAKQKILVQDLFSLETVAHVNTLCLDKTGTITNGNLEVKQVFELQDHLPASIHSYIASFLYYSDDNNATFEAMCKHFPKEATHQPIHKIPFSSRYKWSAAEFEDFGTLIIGAPDKLMSNVPQQIHTYMEEGKRVIIIGKTNETITDTNQLPDVLPLLAIILSDSIRYRVKETLFYFKDEGIDIKVISGDHITTVSAIAKEAGLENWNHAIDLSTLDEKTPLDEVAVKYSVFGRVTPKQKKELVQALQRKGRFVAMTGDGVNDMLALKEADCSIAIAEGSDAVKQMSQVVLLNSDFSCLPDVLLEGRRVINNVTRVAGVFFIKTIYSVLLSILCAIFNFPFPFIPIQITLIDFAIEAFPAFVTMLEPDTRAIKGHFLPNVFRKAIPNAIVIFIAFGVIQGLGSLNAYVNNDIETMLYYSLAILTMQAVIVSCYPFTKLRIATCVMMVLGFITALIILPQLFMTTLLSLTQWLIIIGTVILCILLRLFISNIIDRRSHSSAKA